jgi:hypothetical protein
MRLATFASLLLGLLSVTPRAAAQPRCEAPRVLLTLDKSSSMLGLLPGGGSKWDAARSAIEGVVGTYADRIDFGLQLFPYPDRCEPGRVTMDVGPNDARTIVGALGTPPPDAGNWTPMAQTLDVILGYERLRATGSEAHVILVTDGWQWCSPYDASTRFTPVDSIARLRAAGLTVHVIGFGASVDPLTLNRAAVAAGTALPGCDVTLDDPAAENHCYMQADDLVELRAELDAIARSITDEACNGLDDDCDGTVDEGFDVDVDGMTSCGGDCDDASALALAGAPEVCDGVDNDCDGAADPGCECLIGATRACGTDVGVCVPGEQHCAGGVWGACEGATVAARDACNGLDDDCDGSADEDAGACGAGRMCVEGTCVATDVPAPSAPVAMPVPEDVPHDVLRPAHHASYEPGCYCTAAGAVGGGASGVASFAALLGIIAAAIARARRRLRGTGLA